MLTEINWRPNAGKQSEYLACMAREVLYGGAAGGGKSDAMLMDACKWAYEHDWVRAIVFRRTFPELAELVMRSKQLWSNIATYKESSKCWHFPSGSRVEFGYLGNQMDALRYQSRQFTFIGFEELTQWPNDESYIYLRSRLRSVGMPKDGRYRLKLRATTNPGGPGHTWVKKRWRIPNEGARTDFVDERTGFRRVFIPAKISDNPFLDNTDYKQELLALPTNIQKGLLHGRWDIVAGTMFGEMWNPDYHICDPFVIPSDWKRWRGMDDGYVSYHPVAWMTENPDTKQVIVYNEFVEKRWPPQALGRKIVEMDAINNPLNQKISGVLDSASFSNPGNSEKARGVQMNMAGANWKPSMKSGPASRVARVRHFAQLLRKIPNTETPSRPHGTAGIVFFRTCKYLIETIPTIPICPRNPEDVDTNAEDHGFDAVMYGLQHTPSMSKVFTKLGGI